MAMSATLFRPLAGLLLLLTLLLPATAWAQEPPRVRLEPLRPQVSEVATLFASNLEPEAQYLLSIEGPDREVHEETLEADSQGNVTYDFEMDQAGEWTVRFSGTGLSATLAVETAPAGGGQGEAAEEQEGTEARAQQAGSEASDTDPANEAETQSQEDSPVATEESETAPADEAEAQSQEDSPEVTEERAAQPSPGEEVEIGSDGDAVVAESGGEESWRFDFPEGSGGTGAILVTQESVWVGHGNSLILLDRQSGEALERHPMPGRVIRLEESGDAVSVVSAVNGDLRQRIEVGEDGPGSTVRFGVEPQMFEWLRLEAEVPDPEERLERDSTNPWLLLRVGLDQEESSDRRRLLEQAVAQGDTFYDLAGIAQDLYRSGEVELATEAMDQALEDFARRGYYPELLASGELHDAYNFPLEPFERALDQGDLAAADFWAPWVYLLASQESPATSVGLDQYARELGAAGRNDAANLWRERARADDSSSPAASLDRFFLGLARVGWYGVAALLASILALHLTLVAKYWAPQSLAMRRRMETGGNARPWSRLFAIRYYSFTEKLVLVLLFAACLTLLGLTRWYDAAGERPVALASGSLASPVARDLVTSAQLEGARGAFIRGFAAQSAGETTAAREEYDSAGDYPPALNNLAALEGDDVLYQRALNLAPGMPEPAFNLGRRADPSPFHAAYRSADPLLAVPGTGDFRAAVAGSWQGAIGSTFENPWRSLGDVDFFDLPTLLWQFLLALFLIWVLVTVVWLVIPRPGFARNAPRTGSYHLLALLIPGSGLADEAWGILLMVPWALLGVDALAQWLGWERSLGLPLQTELWALAAIYLVNLIAFIVEFISYRRRMRDLRRRHPEAVEAYGLRNT